MVALLHEQTGFDTKDSERRIFGRVRLHTEASATRLDHSVVARRQPSLKLNVNDVSVGGLSALSDQPVMEGEHIAVRFEPRSGMPVWSAYGHVVRCQPSALGYRVAVEFDPMPAA